jgi:DNA mismatch repair protein MutL
MKRQQIKKIENSDKIAAGEVVERPANVVKELIENSIDAGATQITINIKNAGKALIQVIDNGIGIPSRELVLAFQRHTSSKIRSIEDLNNLHTLGFRGEALASIAAISKVNIISKVKGEELGTQLTIEGGKVIETKEVSAPIGTNIQVKDLFYNTPARKKFLKSDRTELGHISDIIQRYALSYPQNHFVFRHNDMVLLNCPGENDLKTTIFHIYGKKTAKNIEEINYREEGYEFNIYGALGTPEIAKKRRKYSSIFINNRYIKSKLIFRAIEDAYQKVLMINRKPFFVLHIELDPSIIDFNVHPKKLQVRFDNEDYIYNKIYNVIFDRVEELFIKKEPKFKSTTLSSETPSGLEQSSTEIKKQEIPNNMSKPKEYIDVHEEIENKGVNQSTEDVRSVQLDLEDKVSVQDYEGDVPDSLLRRKYIITRDFPKVRPISATGQLSNNIYILLEGINNEGEKGFFILDQHAASERINKEFFLAKFNEGKQLSQKLISPLKVEVSPSESAYLKEHINKIRKIGFQFEHFGGTTYILRGIPTIFNKKINLSIIEDIISDITEIGKDQSFAEVKEEIVNYLACHHSIRGGDDLSIRDIRKVLKGLANCRDPFHCAHGRPTLKFFSFKELDKMFKRT